MQRSIPRELLFFFLMGATIFLVFIFCLAFFTVWYDSRVTDEEYGIVRDGTCSIAVLRLFGDIVPYRESTEYREVTPDDVRTFLKAIESDPTIKGVLVRIDSSGGMPASSRAIADLLKESTLPVLASIGDRGTSGAYLIATGADYILASPYADVGGIGVTMSYLDETVQNEESGLTYVSLTSAPFKDYGSPLKPLTDEERALFERDLSLYHEQFIDDVAENRNLPREDVERLADGASLPASLARASRLVDGVGGDDMARGWFAEKLGVGRTEISLCE